MQSLPEGIMFNFSSFKIPYFHKIPKSSFPTVVLQFFRQPSLSPANLIVHRNVLYSTFVQTWTVKCQKFPASVTNSSDQFLLSNSRVEPCRNRRGCSRSSKDDEGIFCETRRLSEVRFSRGVPTLAGHFSRATSRPSAPLAFASCWHLNRSKGRRTAGSEFSAPSPPPAASSSGFFSLFHWLPA